VYSNKMGTVQPWMVGVAVRKEARKRAQDEVSFYDTPT
jgi:hypothetical protein